ncbi:hypothetical protein C0J50_21175 [Silurus asotus]|uniref:Paralemmin-3 n=1 Tax=Silurus asotus TaxID=30991 RepID=A0AAD5ALY0_SILAS|nr:hypothetical protein C0J50_21175 [Silurus asotus]
MSYGTKKNDFSVACIFVQLGSICIADMVEWRRLGMDEAGKYQQRLQTIAEKRRIQEEEEKVRRKMEEEQLKLAQHKRKSQREQWLMEVTPSSTEDPKQKSGIPTLQTKEQSVEDSEILMEKETEITESMKEESTQIGENEPSSYSEDDTEQPAQANLGEEEINVLEVLETEVEQNLLPKASQEDTEEERKAETEELNLNQLEHIDQPHHVLPQTPDEVHFSLADRNTELFIAEDNAEVEEEEWEMVNCSPEKELDLVLTSDSTEAPTDSVVDHKDDGTVLKVEQVFISDKKEGIEIGASEVLNLVVAEKVSVRSREERPPEGEIQTHAGTSAPLQELSNVSGIISKEPVYSVECELDLPAHAEHTQRILGVNTEYKGDQSVSASRIVNVECKDVPRPESEVIQYVSLDRKREKSSSLLKKGMVAQSTEQESEIQVLMPSSVTPNRAETVTSPKKKTCQCCSVM